MARPAPRPAAKPAPKPPPPPPRPAPSRPAPAPVRPPAPTTRPAPKPAPGKPPTPPAGKPRPPAGKPPTPPAGKPTPGPVVRGPGGAPKTKPPKPAGNPGPGQSWVYNAQTNSWQKKRNSIATPNKPTTSTVTSQPDGSTTVVDTPAGSDADETGAPAAAPVPEKTAEQIAGEVRAAAESRVADLDPTLRGEYTGKTLGLGGLGFGLSKADGTRATYDEIFGSAAPGGAPQAGAFQVRDAQGRLVNRDLLGTDVFGAGGTGTDLSGTKLGQTILGARRTAASEAEARSRSGTGSGGLRTAAGEQQVQREGAEITGLLGELTNLTTDIGGRRSRAFSEAQEEASSGDIGRFNPEVTPPRAGATTPPPAKPKPKPVKPKPTKPNVPKAPGGAGKTRPPKPAGNPGPGRKWVYNAKSNSWQAARR